jgi:hypothetical protein
MNRTTRIVLAGLVGAVLAGCARGRCCPPVASAPATVTVTKTVTATSTVTVAKGTAAAPAGLPFSPSGFLDHYAQMKPGKHPETWYWMKDDVDLRAYDRLMFDPIVFKPAPGSLAKDLTEEQCSKVCEGFRQILVRRVDPYYPVLEKPAEHTLLVRLAVTDASPTIAETASAKAQVGGATLEGEIRDAMTGEVILQFVSRITGSTRSELASVREEWKPVEGAFREWADRLLDFLDAYTKVHD